MNPLDLILEEVNARNLWQGSRSVSRNEYVKLGGTIDQNVYFVEHGALRAFLISELEEHTIRFGYQGDILAALDSYITGAISDLFIQALKNSEIKYLSRSVFIDLIAKHSSLQEAWQASLELLIVQQLEREIDLLTQSPSARYQRVLARSPRLFQEIPHKYIASYLRMTPETLSRLQKS